MLLENKNAVIYGAGGRVGSAVAHAFVREGARLFLAGRDAENLDELARDLSAPTGTVVDVAQVDALDDGALRRHVDQLVEKADRIDVCFNSIGDYALLGTSLIDMSLADFMRPVNRLVTAQFLIATTVGRHMIDRNSGVILTMTGSGAPTAGMGGAMTAWAAVDALCGQLAREFGSHGIRVLWLRSNGVTEEGEDNPGERERSMLNRLASPADVANVAVFLASDLARTMTATAANVTSGAEV